MTSNGSVFAGRFAAIVGAPRCGTTSLARYLEVHPDVAFSHVKEPHYFSQFDLRGLDGEQLREAIDRDYLERFFPNAEPSGRLLMEGSVTYLYTPAQIEPILRVWPDARFIIAVRDPFSMLPSLHQRLLLLGDETETDFERAWDLAPDRAEGRHIPRTCIEAAWLQYPEIGRLGKYVEQFFDTVGRERCLVVVFDDFVADPAAAYRKVLAFLGLSDDRRTDFPPERVSRAYRWAWLQRLLKRPPRFLWSLMAGEKFRHRHRKNGNGKSGSWLVPAIIRARNRVLDWNEVPTPTPALSPRMQAEIRQALAADVKDLARLLDRDLSHWLGGIPEADREPPAEPPADKEPAPVEA